MVSSGEEPEIDREFLEAQAERDYLRRNPALAERYARENDHKKLLKENIHLRPHNYEDWGREHHQELQLSHKPKGNTLYARKIKTAHVKPDVNDDRELTEDEGESSPRRETLCEKVGKSLKNCFRKNKKSGGTRKRRPKRSRK